MKEDIEVDKSEWYGECDCGGQFDDYDISELKFAEDQETEKLRERVYQLTEFVTWVKEMTDYAVEDMPDAQMQNRIAKILLERIEK